MFISSRLRKTTVTTLLLAVLAPSAALAHPGHDAGQNLMAGLLHPLTGLDHVLMIVAIGAWSALQPRRERLTVAVCLALFVVIGALLPIGGSAALEAVIATTVIGAGLVLAVGRRWPLWATGTLSAVFAVIHGFAHGAEGPGRTVPYLAGLMLATLALALGASSLAAPRGHTPTTWLRVVGLCSAATGMALLA